MKKLITAFFILIYTVSCSPYSTHMKSYTLNVKKQETFLLDAKSTLLGASIQYADIREGKYFTFLNVLNNAIYLYDYETNDLLKKIQLNTEGPNDVGVAFSHLIYSFDSIFIFNQGRQIVSLIDTAGIVKGKWKTPNLPMAQFFTSESDPMVFTDDKLWINNLYPGSIKHEIKACINLLTDSTCFMFHYPVSCYDEPGELIMPNYYFIYHAYNTTDKLFVYSFPHSDSIYVTNHAEYTKAFFAAGTAIGTGIDPHYSGSWEETMSLLPCTPEYIKMLYDPYRKLYYRIGRIPLTEDEYLTADEHSKIARPWEIIVLSEDFVIIGNVLLEKDTYFAYKSFVSEEGLCIARYDLSLQQEDQAVFDVFVPESIINQATGN